MEKAVATDPQKVTEFQSGITCCALELPHPFPLLHPEGLVAEVPL